MPSWLVTFELVDSCHMVESEEQIVVSAYSVQECGDAVKKYVEVEMYDEHQAYNVKAVQRLTQFTVSSDGKLV